MDNLPKFSVINSDVWQKSVDTNRDSYGRCVIEYSARWANMMEEAINNGAKLEDVAGELSHKADTECITGFMYGAAVSTLVACWEHGDQLRRWHNKKYQIHDEGDKANENGGVLNPALLNLEVPNKIVGCG